MALFKENNGHKRHRLPDWLLCLLLAAVAIGIYSNTIGGPFVFDDHENIARNPHLQITRLDWPSLHHAAFGGVISTRPVSYISFALNYYFLGYRVDGYHWINILIHAINGILLYFFLKQTLNLVSPETERLIDTPDRKDRDAGYRTLDLPSQVAFFSALLWVAHPVQTQAVAYIIQRMTSMAAMFYLLALLFYIHARLSKTIHRSVLLWVGVVVSGVLAMGSKEIAVTLPAVILLYEFFFFRNLRITPSWLIASLVGLVLFAAIVLVSMGSVDPVHLVLKGYHSRDFSIGQRLLTEFRVVVFYLSLILFPHPSRLNLDHDVALSHGLLDPPTILAAIALILGLLVMAGILAKRNRFVSFCILWFLGNLVLESSVIALELVFEHRLYLPSMMVFPVMVLLVFRTVTSTWASRAVVGATIIICVIWTVDRNRVWQDEVGLHRDTVAKSPLKARPYYGLGRALAERGDYREAVDMLQEAVRLNPGYVQARNRLGSALAMLGDSEAAAVQFHKVIQLDPGYVGAYFNLDKYYENTKNYAAATAQFGHAAALAPGMTQTLYRLAWILSTCPDEQVRNGPEALSWAERLIRITGTQNPLALATLSAALAENGRFDAAVQVAQQAEVAARTYGMGDLEEKIREQLNTYRSNRPFREPERG